MRLARNPFDVPHTDHPIDRLPALALGEDDDPSLREHVAACATCSGEIAALGEVLGRLPGALPQPETPSDTRQRVLGTVAHLERFSHRAVPLAALFDVPTNEARLCLHALSEEARWRLSPIEGITWLPVKVGPARRPGKGMLAHLAAGTEFPRHRHEGAEHVLVLDGELVEPDGVHPAGSLIEHPIDSVHTIGAAAGGGGCVCAILNLGPIELLP